MLARIHARAAVVQHAEACRAVVRLIETAAQPIDGGSDGVRSALLAPALGRGCAMQGALDAMQVREQEALALGETFALRLRFRRGQESSRGAAPLGALAGFVLRVEPRAQGGRGFRGELHRGFPWLAA